ncbi:MAG: hypothetical protein B2I17_08525 [Thermoplasmatales archaeon B_DKE]|nr:MAG: hypothetical protein B2I17_08525 [Thermoplasmatales archaeon B_DKE]
MVRKSVHNSTTRKLKTVYEITPVSMKNVTRIESLLFLYFIKVTGKTHPIYGWDESEQNEPKVLGD